jgi:hypothetical protein
MEADSRRDVGALPVRRIRAEYRFATGLDPANAIPMLTTHGVGRILRQSIRGSPEPVEIRSAQELIAGCVVQHPIRRRILRHANIHRDEPSEVSGQRARSLSAPSTSKAVCSRV